MIEFYKILFATPEILWTIGQKFAVAGLVLAITAVICLAILVVGKIIALISQIKNRAGENK